MFSLTSLRLLLLGNNQFSYQLEDFKYSNSLVNISLRGNQLQGNLPKSIQNLVSVTWIDLSSNNFSGHVDVSLFSDLKHLWYLSLSYNRISLTNENKVKSFLPESLGVLRLASCEVKELEFLKAAKQLLELDLSNNKIQGRIPDWHGLTGCFCCNYLIYPTTCWKVLIQFSSVCRYYWFAVQFASRVTAYSSKFHKILLHIKK